MGEGKAKNVIQYLDYLIEKGKASNGAITPIKIAFTKVMQSVEGEKWETVDVKDLNIDDYMGRFANLTMGKYSSDSLTVYKSRVNRALTWYEQFLKTPGWAPEIGKRVSSPKPRKEGKKPATIVGSETQPVTSALSMPDVASSPDRILYPFPLTNGGLIHLSLPTKLSKQDAKRIGQFVESIALEEPARLEATNS